MQCKQFLGRSKAEREVKDILSWFEIAVNHVEGDPKIGDITRLLKELLYRFLSLRKL